MNSKKESYQKFIIEIDRIWKLEGIDWITEKTNNGVTKDDLKGITASDSFSRYITGNFFNDKENIVKFKELFNKEKFNNKDIIHNLLFEIMPESLKQLKREIESWLNNKNPQTGKKNTWADFEELTGVTRGGAYFYRYGYHYPERETLIKLKPIVSEKTINDILKELHGIDSIAVNNLIDLSEVTNQIDAYSDEDKGNLILEAAKSIKDNSRLVKIARDIMNDYLAACNL